MTQSPHPVVIIGAGPVGLAAAANLQQRHEPFLVLEAGDQVGAAVQQWAHVRMFSPWEFNIDPASATLLEQTAWTRPANDAYPTGRDIVDQYLAPLAAHPAIQPHIRLKARVTGVGRLGMDRMKSLGRQRAPFAVRVDTPDGEQEILAKAVIDASGTYRTPNPLGAAGYPALGERALARSGDGIFYGIPEVGGRDRDRYVGKRVLVVGSGHSAMNVLLDLVHLAEEGHGGRITWAVRRRTLLRLFGGGQADQLPERGRLGSRLQEAVASGQVEVVTGFEASALERTADGVVVRSADRALSAVDEVVVSTGFRPDLSLTTEVRLDLDAIVESPRTLAALIDPNVHSCGSVPPHGAEQLAHPEEDFYIVGMKSYGRAPTFLLRTGYEQVRSVVCALVGDEEGAKRVELTLPETGVCSTDRPEVEAQPLTLTAKAAGEPGCCIPLPASAGESRCCGS